MSSWVSFFKDIFFMVGSVAGVLAFIRPVVESKHKKDLERLDAILAKFPENQIMALDSWVYSSRRISSSVLMPFDEIEHKYEFGWQEMNFSGPLRRVLEQEIVFMIGEYRKFRGFVQVPEWEPKEVDGEYEWIFNKNYFREGYSFSEKYVEHLEQATDVAAQLKKRYQRIQALTDLHLLEAILGRFYVPRLFKTRNLD
ncbi:hypothetical protein [Oceanimonas smirnovii]|uniref:hypothetical protein n=1 Tax=Oceanimonas smirnovii TaxID=264574 RepID=UPI003FD3E229